MPKSLFERFEEMRDGYQKASPSNPMPDDYVVLWKMGFAAGASAMYAKLRDDQPTRAELDAEMIDLCADIDADIKLGNWSDDDE